jgi:hypothetical protein
MGIVSLRSKALSKIFENFEPQIPEKDGEMKQGLKAKLRLQAGPRFPSSPEADLSPKCGAKVEHAMAVQ